MAANGEMLRLARQRNQLGQAEAAELLGIKQPVLSRIENGLMIADDELLERAESAYGLPRSFFFLGDPLLGPPVSVHPMWRKKADVTGYEMDAIVAELNIRLLHIRRLMRNVEVATASNIPALDIEEYESPTLVAEKLRAHWQIPSGPIKNLTVFVERAGILVAHSRLGGTNVSGVTFRAPGMPPLIVLNSEQPADRMRYTLAHEVGHVVMHRFPNPNMEEEANKFASAFLMPQHDIAPSFEGRRIDLPLLGALKPEWKVSMQSLLMRAESLGYLSASQYQRLWRQIGFHGLRLREPPELDFPAESPTVLPKVFKVYQEALNYSLSELCGILHIHEKDLREMYQLGEPLPETPRFVVLN